MDNLIFESSNDNGTLYYDMKEKYKECSLYNTKYRRLFLFGRNNISIKNLTDREEIIEDMKLMNESYDFNININDIISEFD